MEGSARSTANIATLGLSNISNSFLKFKNPKYIFPYLGGLKCHGNSLFNNSLVMVQTAGESLSFLVVLIFKFYGALES